MSFKWTNGFNDNEVEGLVYSSSGEIGNGQHGSIGSTEHRSVLFGYGPDFKENNVVENPTGNIDIAPTIIELLGIDTDTNFDGRIITEGLISRSRISSDIRMESYHAKRNSDGILYEQELESSVLGNSVYINDAKVF